MDVPLPALPTARGNPTGVAGALAGGAGIGIDHQVKLLSTRARLAAVLFQVPSPCPNTFGPAESITALTGPSVLESADATSRLALRRERVV